MYVSLLFLTSVVGLQVVDRESRLSYSTYAVREGGNVCITAITVTFEHAPLCERVNVRTTHSRILQSSLFRAIGPNIFISLLQTRGFLPADLIFHKGLSFLKKHKTLKLMNQ